MPEILVRISSIEIDTSRIFSIIVIAVLCHVSVSIIRIISNKLSESKFSNKISAIKTATSLLSSCLIFIIYFSAAGFILNEFGISLKAYFASASIVGLAVGFGSQGLVQDVVTGVTLVFSDLIDIGDMVEISGQTGVVERIGMRFTILKNAYGSHVFIPNRTIANVVNYPRGYMRCLVDITITENVKDKIDLEKIKSITDIIHDSFPGVLRAETETMGTRKSSSGKEYLRIKFRIWPNRGSPIETVFKQELLAYLKSIDNSYSDWMVYINYEIEANA